MKLNIIGPNLLDQSKGSFHAHKAGCADTKKAQYRFHQNDLYEAEYDSKTEAADDIYGDMIAEGSMKPGEGLSDIYFFPCTDGLPTETAKEPA